jgi:hypothetical protein
VLDRLVDGELGPSQRRELLAALDDEPGAWRRCALAFLEAQSWRRGCRQLAAEPAAAGPVPEGSLASVENRLLGPRAVTSRQFWRPAICRRREVRRMAARLTTAAAVLLAAFIGGLATGRAWSAAAGPTQIAGNAASGSQDGGGGPNEGRMIVHLLGFINVRGEDGAQQAVPILAAPGLKVEAPQPPATTLAGGAPASDLRTPRGAWGPPLTFSLSTGQHALVPADAVALAPGQPIY